MTQNNLVGCEVILGVICHVPFEGQRVAGADSRSDFFHFTFGPRSGR
jgi:hypothetical protein